MTKSVMILGPSFNYGAMFISQGWNITDTLRDADLLQFTGGPDVSPALYKQRFHKTTHIDAKRDTTDLKFFNLAINHHVPMAGICRGAQFLNVMNGGALYQNVDGHQIAGTHTVVDHYHKDNFQATSTHHQMMIPAEGAFVIGTALESKVRTRMPSNAGAPIDSVGASKDYPDAEVVYYAGTNCLCFQPHPEHPGHTQLKLRYFNMLDEFLLSFNWRETCAAL